MSPTPATPDPTDCVGRFSDACTVTPELNSTGEHLTNLYAALEPGAIDPNVLHAQQPLIEAKLQALGLITDTAPTAGFPWAPVLVSLVVVAVIAAVIGIWHLTHRAPTATEG